MDKMPDKIGSKSKLVEPDFDSIPIETKVWIHGAIEQATERALWLIALIVLIMSFIDRELFSINGVVLAPLLIFLGFLMLGVLSPLAKLQKNCAESIPDKDQQEIYTKVCGALPTVRDAAKAGVATVIFLVFAFYFG
jgi:hypothetical protein